MLLPDDEKCGLNISLLPYTFPEIFVNIFLALYKSLLLSAMGNVLRFGQLPPLQMPSTAQSVSINSLIDLLSSP
jgi:hypothetical protein